MRKFKKNGVAALSAVSLGATLIGSMPAAYAVDFQNASFDVALNEYDGLSDLTQDNNPGNDSASDNKIIRTNDILRYSMEVRTPSNVENTTITLEFPSGMYMKELPGFCLTGELTERNQPSTPYTNESYKELGAQTMICNVGSRKANSTITYDLDTYVSGWVPNGTKLQASAKVSGDDQEDLIVDLSEFTVSAKVRGDVSKNGDAVEEEEGYVYKSGGTCSFDSDRYCQTMNFSLMTMVPKGGVGASPVTGVELVEDLRPESFYPEGVTTSQAWLDAEANYPGGAMAKYAPRLGKCTYSNGLRNAPGYRIGSEVNATETNSVPDSGVFDECGDGTPGGLQTVKLTDIDGAAESCPTEAFRGGSLRTDVCIVSSPYLRIEIPNDAVKELGAAANNGDQTLQVKNVISDIKLKSIETQDYIPNSWEKEFNNHRSAVFSVGNRGSVSKLWAGLVDDPYSTDPKTYGSMYGPPGGYKRGDQNISVMAGQKIIGMIATGTSGGTGDVNNSIICDAWDNTKMHLSGGPFAADPSVYTQRYGTTDPKVPAWVSYYGSVDTLDKPIDEFYQVQYAYDPNGSGPGEKSECNRALDWKDDPADFANNDPSKLAENVYTGPNRVRYYYSLPSTTKSRTVYHAMGFEIARELDTVGTLIPNWGSEIRYYTDPGTTATMDEVYENGYLKNASYEPERASGSIGARVILSKAYVRLDKKIRKEGSQSWVDTVSTTGGGKLQFKIEPSILSSVVTGQKYPVMVEDCINPSLSFDGASIDPSMAVTVEDTMPEDSKIECAPGDVYLRWNLGDIVPRTVIDPIIVDVHVKKTADEGSFNSKAEVSTYVDPSPSAQRSEDVSYSIQQPAGIVIEKSALTPVTQINRTGSSETTLNSWLVEMASIKATASNPRVIDILPRDGLNKSDFDGTRELVEIKQVSDTGNANIDVLYTEDVNVNNDPAHISNNENSGTTQWCDSKDAGGQVVYPTSDAGQPCGGGSVTAVMFERPGPFESGDSFSMQVDMRFMGNVAGNVYDNTATASADGLMTIGPVGATEKVISSSIGDTVWADTNRNGIQDEGEKTLANVDIDVQGTDDLGNRVSMSLKTDENGKYLVDGVRQGNYDLTFDLPEGYVGFSTQNVGDDNKVDSDVDDKGKVSVEIGQDVTNLDIDAGLVTSESTPTPTPTEEPTPTPTEEPTPTPTPTPTEEPTPTPTEEPTPTPTPTPTETPTEEPTGEPTETPTEEPTEEPTGEPIPTDEPDDDDDKSDEVSVQTPTPTVVEKTTEAVVVAPQDVASQATVIEGANDSAGTPNNNAIDSGEVDSKYSLTAMLLGLGLALAGIVILVVRRRKDNS